MPTDNKFGLWAIVTIIPSLVSILVATATVTLSFQTRVAKLEVGHQALGERVIRDENIMARDCDGIREEIKSFRKSVSKTREYVRDFNEKLNAEVLKHINNSDLHARELRIEQKR